MIKLFHLTPLGEIFFGGEATFGPNENRHYFVRSNLWPQQSSLLGLLRYELLKSNPAVFDQQSDRITKPIEAAEWVGKQGFDGSTDAPFGIIDGLSPVFLLNESGEPYFLQSRFDLIGAKKTWLERTSGQPNNFASENLLSRESVKEAGYQLLCEKTKKDGPITEPFDGKMEFKTRLVGLNGDQLPVHFDKTLASDGVFIRVEKTGNRKNYDGASDDSGFYKQDMFKLRPGWKFGFLAAFNRDLPAGFGSDRKTHFGAERRAFRLKCGAPAGVFAEIQFVENAFQGFQNLYGGTSVAPEPLQQVILLSDAAVSPEIQSLADFSLTESIPFRHFRPSLGHPNALWQAPDEAPKSNLYNLLRRGSSLFVEDASQIQKKLTDPRAFRRIGYNYFKTISH